jgi:hypothetical protein
LPYRYPETIGQPVGSITGIGEGFLKQLPESSKRGRALLLHQESGACGFRIELADGERIYPNTMKDLAKGVSLYRNYDTALARLLKKASSRRQIGVRWILHTRTRSSDCQ